MHEKDWIVFVVRFFSLGKRDRTADLLHAMQALSQLSYTPERNAILRDIFDLVNSIRENRILKSKN